MAGTAATTAGSGPAVATLARVPRTGPSLARGLSLVCIAAFSADRRRASGLAYPSLPTRGAGDERETAMRPRLFLALALGVLALAALLGSAGDGRADPADRGIIGSGY